MSLGACLGPMQEMGMNVKHPASITWAQTLRYRVFRFNKSTARLKFTKLGMLSWSGINMPWKFFVPFGAGLGICFSKTRASHNNHDGFGRECTTFGEETISIASYCFQIFSRVNIEQQECCVNFCDFSGFVWTFLCIN